MKITYQFCTVCRTEIKPGEKHSHAESVDTQKLVLCPELVEALEGVLRLSNAKFDEAVGIMAKVKEVMVKAKALK